MAKLTKRTVDAVEPRAGQYILFDDDLKGFGLRVTPNGVKAYVFEYKPGRGMSPRRMTLGRANVLTAEEARKRAKLIAAEVASGGDPGKEKARERAQETFGEFAERYLRDHVALQRKAGTASLYEIYLRVHVRPVIGSIKLAQVTRADVERLRLAIARGGKKVTANRVIKFVSGVFSYAEEHKALPEGSNPARGIKPYPEAKGGDRMLTPQQLEALARALSDAETVGLPWVLDDAAKAKHRPKDAAERRDVLSRHATGAIRLLLLTGCRLREILHLRWDDVSWEAMQLALPDSKTGRKAVFLNAPALAELQTLKEIRVGRYVIAGASAGQKDETPRADLQKSWRRVCAAAGLKGVKLHDLRHTFASYGAMGGMGLPMVGELLGHRNVETTARYAHLAPSAVHQASEAIAATITAAMAGETGKVIRLRR